MPRRQQHPPFCGDPCSPPSRDFCTREGAEVLAARIRAAWAALGVHVETKVEQVGQGYDSMFTVRLPNLLNGMPVKAMEIAA